MNKRGISPLVATLILIGFSIALGAIVMSWGRGYIEEKAEFVIGVEASPLECGAVSIKVIEIGNKPEICLDNGNIKALIENGAANIDNIQARIVGTGGIATEESILLGVLQKNQAAEASFSAGNVGNIKQVKLTPYILINREKDYCSDRSITFENIVSCS